MALPNILYIPSLFWLIMSIPLTSDSRYVFNPCTNKIWYPEELVSQLIYITGYTNQMSVKAKEKGKFKTQ